MWLLSVHTRLAWPLCWLMCLLHISSDRGLCSLGSTGHCLLGSGPQGCDLGNWVQKPQQPAGLSREHCAVHVTPQCPTLTPVTKSPLLGQVWPSA